jgi:hypothetical protein
MGAFLPNASKLTEKKKHPKACRSNDLDRLNNMDTPLMASFFPLVQFAESQASS